MAALERAFGLSGTGLRRERARALAEASGAVVVLKGPDTVVAAPGGDVVVSPRASSWLSVAGTGDVLAGTIASRLATHGESLRAAVEGLWLHAEAARLCGPAFTAGELAHAVQAALKECHE
jgi:NAD(P)H-hydrate repair Nnr-like enzyme with NAD(P)H-hydrate dehydratase domain